jgi:hypothetical protein
MTGLFAIFSSTVSKSPVLPPFAAHLGFAVSFPGASVLLLALAILFRMGVENMECKGQGELFASKSSCKAMISRQQSFLYV